MNLISQFFQRQKRYKKEIKFEVTGKYRERLKELIDESVADKHKIRLLEREIEDLKNKRHVKNSQ